MNAVDGIRRRRFLGALAGSAAAVLGGCLGGDDAEVDLSDEAWEDVTEIRLAGHQSHGWTGVAPEAIEDVTNPTLVLYEGREYDLTWENEDGAGHNVELRTEDGDVLESTSLMNEKGATQTLSFEASAEMTTYLCLPHRTSMVGDLEVREE